MVACVQFLRCCAPATTIDLRRSSSGGDLVCDGSRGGCQPADGGLARGHIKEVCSEEQQNGWSPFGDGSSSDRSEVGDGGLPAGRTRSSVREGLSAMGLTRSLENGRLLDEYVLGAVLGQGSFGIVFACKRKEKDSGHELAVKLVDKVESLPEDIAREVRTQVMLDHPNILKVHEVIDEKCFLCIVTDRLPGGDLVKCLQSHASAGKRIRSGKIVHVVRQMLNAIVYLHGLCIVHRDIKGDNYLLDRVSLMDSKCLVVLADFGFACECKLGDRLWRRCGTRAYWPPELWDRSYTLRVDIWALGVTLYGILEGSLPFQSEWDVKHRDVVCHPFTSQRCADLVRQLLSKLEVTRPTAIQALAHPWITGRATDNEGEEKDIEWGPRVDAIKVHEPDAGVAARRLELVERLEGLHMRRKLNQSSEGSTKRKVGGWNSDSSLDSANATPLAILIDASFHVMDKLADKIRTFEWWEGSRVQSMGLQNVHANASEGVAAFNAEGRRYSNTKVVGQMLEAQGIDTSLFGQGFAKTLERFADELESGASQLMMDAAKHRALVRVVDVVLLRLSLTSGTGTHYMIVAADEQLDGRMRSDLNRLPGTKKRPHENLRNVAERILLEMPDVDIEDVTFDFDTTEVFEEQEESPSYPGVRTVYRKQTVSGVLERKSNKRGWRFQGLDAMSHKSARSTKFFSWLTEDECLDKQVKLRAPKQGAEVSSLVPAPIGLKVKALGRYLKANDIDPSAFGRDHTKTLQELSTELITGESSLMTLPNGTLVRIVDVVLLMVTKSGTDSVLVVAKECSASAGNTDVALNRLPGTKRRPDENHFHAAKRVLQRQLKVNENYIDLDAGSVQICEEEKDSPSYPGLRTVYRKRIISAQLDVGSKILPIGRSTVSPSVATEPRLEWGLCRPQSCGSPAARRGIALGGR